MLRIDMIILVIYWRYKIIIALIYNYGGVPRSTVVHKHCNNNLLSTSVHIPTVPFTPLRNYLTVQM